MDMRAVADPYFAESGGGTLAPVDGYVTETFCRRSRYFRPENGMRIDAVRDEIELPALVKAVFPVAASEDRLDAEAIVFVRSRSQDLRAIRDRALFELAYSSGLRLSELSGLDLDAIDPVAGEVRVLGKGAMTGDASRDHQEDHGREQPGSVKR